MKSIVFVIATLAAAASAGAQEIGQVLSSTPVIGQVAVPQQFCDQQSVIVPGRSSGGGAALGAISGAVIGSAIGHGGGRGAGAVIGMVGGALIGDQLDGRNADQIQQVRRCTTHTAYENRVLHYDVVYAYAGRQYAVQLPNDPGPAIQVQVTPVGAIAPPPASMAIAEPIRLAPTITTIQSSVEYVPYLAPMRMAPLVIAVPPVVWGYAPRQHRHVYRANPPYPGGAGHGHRPRWR